jgi:UDP-N-acetylglucosamine:LPS N-acetylglucosamine transferase
MKQPINALFFSRGRGYGHAIPDLAIASVMHELHPEISIQFASYATGAEVFRRANAPVIDLNLPEANPFLDTLFLAEKLIEEEDPDVVIAHEEFAALAAARSHSVPSVFISAWLPPAGTIHADALRCADSIIVIERAGLFPIPAGVTAEPRFTGPILRKMQCSLADKIKVREKLGLGQDATVILVVSGGWANEKRAPIADLILPAFSQLPHRKKKLVWLAGKDRAQLQEAAAAFDDIQVLDYYAPVEEMIVASDLVVTKGTRGITIDAATIGVPSLSISHGLNPVDDLLVPRIRSNIAVNSNAIDCAGLAQCIEQILAQPAATWGTPMLAPDHGGHAAAAALCEEILYLIPSDPALPASRSGGRPGS